MKQNVRTSNESLHTFLMKAMCGLVMLLSAVSCTDETESMGQSSPLTMNITVNDGASRAVIESGALPDGSLVGVTVVDASGTTYNGNNYSNIKGTTSGTSLSLAGEVLITDTDATIYGYYPWASGVSETAVPLTAGSTDYLYAAPITGINNGNASATLSMSHALACLRLKINRGYYSGTGALTTLAVESASLSTAGTLNARTGTVTATGTNVYETNLSQTISDATLTQDIMVIPTGTAADITFTLLVDGNQYYVTTENVTLTKGGMYEYTIDIESLTWDNAPNGVYAVKKEGNNLIPVTYENIDINNTDQYIAVALIVNDVVDAEGNPNPQRIMIEKYETANTAWNCETNLYWGENLYGKDVADIKNIITADGTNYNGYLSNDLSIDYTTWTSGALSDFKGKDNTADIIAAYTEHSVSMVERDMCSVLQTFNQENDEDWYIPACGQLALMYLNKTSINEALNSIEGTPLNTSSYYWSSSEGNANLGWPVHFSGGSVYSYSKNSSRRVRFVQDIK